MGMQGMAQGARASGVENLRMSSVAACGMTGLSTLSMANAGLAPMAPNFSSPPYHPMAGQQAFRVWAGKTYLIAIYTGSNEAECGPSESSQLSCRPICFPFCDIRSVYFKMTIKALGFIGFKSTNSKLHHHFMWAPAPRLKWSVSVLTQECMCWPLGKPVNAFNSSLHVDMSLQLNCRERHGLEYMCVFSQVVKGTDVILNIEKSKTDRNDKPLGEMSTIYAFGFGSCTCAETLILLATATHFLSISDCVFCRAL